MPSLFERFLTDYILQFTCNESVRYAQNKGNLSYKLEWLDPKAVIAIFLIKGYVDLPQNLMFWEWLADVHYDAVSSMMSRNRFDAVMKYLYLADSTRLDPNDKFRKVRPTKKSFHHSSGIPVEFHWSHGKLLENDSNKWNLWNSSEILVEFQQFIILTLLKFHL